MERLHNFRTKKGLEMIEREKDKSPITVDDIYELGKELKDRCEPPVYLLNKRASNWFISLPKLITIKSIDLRHPDYDYYEFDPFAITFNIALTFDRKEFNIMMGVSSDIKYFGTLCLIEYGDKDELLNKAIEHGVSEEQASLFIAESGATSLWTRHVISELKKRL